MGYLDDFISCMLVAPCTPTYSGKGIVGGRGASIQSFKKYIVNMYVSATLGLV